MKLDERPLLTDAQTREAAALGAKLARLRHARRLRQADAAVKAGLSRSTAVLIEAGDARRTLGQVLRYLHAVAPGLTLLDLLQEKDPALLARQLATADKRVRLPSKAELEQLDF